MMDDRNHGILLGRFGHIKKSVKKLKKRDFFFSSATCGPYGDSRMAKCSSNFNFKYMGKFWADF